MEISSFVMSSIAINTIIGEKSIPLNEEGINRFTVSYKGIVIDWINFGRKFIPKSTNHESITSINTTHWIRERKITREKIKRVIDKLFLISVPIVRKNRRNQSFH